MTKFDIVFLSYYEANAEHNWNTLLASFPHAMRINGVTGIRNGFIAAASCATTKLFWLVDADAVIVDTFNFTPPERIDDDTAYVWRSLNPINKLVYGHGGIKLLPRENTLRLKDLTVDMTTSIAAVYKPVQIISNITAFNTDPYSTWRTAFRETVKLSSNAIEKNPSKDTLFRLNAWCTINSGAEFGDVCIDGAIAGKNFGEKNKSNLVELQKINDFGWIHDQYTKYSLAKNS